MDGCITHLGLAASHSTPHAWSHRPQITQYSDGAGVHSPTGHAAAHLVQGSSSLLERDLRAFVLNESDAALLVAAARSVAWR